MSKRKTLSFDRKQKENKTKYILNHFMKIPNCWSIIVGCLMYDVS